MSESATIQGRNFGATLAEQSRVFVEAADSNGTLTEHSSDEFMRKQIEKLNATLDHLRAGGATKKQVRAFHRAVLTEFKTKLGIIEK